MTGSLQQTEQALQRLGNALERLEEAAALRAGSGDLLLAGELRGARDDYASLEDTARVVASRLDAAITRLHHLLEE